MADGAVIGHGDFARAQLDKAIPTSVDSNEGTGADLVLEIGEVDISSSVSGSHISFISVVSSHEAKIKGPPNIAAPSAGAKATQDSLMPQTNTGIASQAIFILDELRHSQITIFRMKTNDEDPKTIRERRQQRQRALDQNAEQRRAAVRGHLERAGLSQKEACNLAGLRNASALGNFLAGRARSLNLATLEPLAKALGLSVSELIGEEPAKPPPATTLPDSGPTSEVIVERNGLRVTIKTNEPERLLRSLFNLGPAEKLA